MSIMRTAEEAILSAVLDGDTETAERLISEMLPGERGALFASALELQRLTAPPQSR